jgi:putative SOS response-associated peptidase YedK
MCGRFVSSSPKEELAAYFDAEPVAPELASSWNVAPTNDIYAVLETPEGRKLEVVHWGLIPAWAKDVKIGQKMINARSETLAGKGAFASAFKRHRCLIPADGFYEWQATNQLTAKGKPAKQPMYIHRKDGEPLAFAGLWAAWRDPNGGPDAPWIHSATIITTSANETMAPVHNRMPVILPASAWTEWLDIGNQNMVTLGELLVPAPNDLLTMHAVSKDVNNVRNKGPELAEPVPPSPEQQTPDTPPNTLF